MNYWCPKCGGVFDPSTLQSITGFLCRCPKEQTTASSNSSPMNTTSKTPWTNALYDRGNIACDARSNSHLEVLTLCGNLEAAYHEAVGALEESFLRMERRYIQAELEGHPRAEQNRDALYLQTKAALSTYAALKREMEGREG